ncbi:hypothetical protein AU374_01030 [Cupriavidus metallidurans]|nr:hypothetical protein AU374_01030 [Cupriavidus metallidurans]
MKKAPQGVPFSFAAGEKVSNPGNPSKRYLYLYRRK